LEEIGVNLYEEMEEMPPVEGVQVKGEKNLIAGLEGWTRLSRNEISMNYGSERLYSNTLVVSPIVELLPKANGQDGKVYCRL
jgi:hypothetical protein